MRYLYLIPFFLAFVAMGSPLLLTFTWTDTADNETGFRLYVRDSPSSVWEILADFDTPNVEFYEDTFEVEEGDHFETMVTAYNATEESAPSNIEMIDVPITVPSPTDTGWIYWEDKDGGTYFYSLLFGWVWGSEETMPYFFFFDTGEWKEDI